MKSLNPNVDPDRILSHAKSIAFPRYPGSEGDVRAIDILSNAFRESNLPVDVEEFSYDIRPAFRVLRIFLLAVALMVVGSGVASSQAPVVSVVLLILSMIAGGTFLLWSPWLERLYQRPGPTRTANISARRRCQEPRLTLIFLAHHDSKSQSLTMPVRAGLTLAALAGFSLQLGRTIWIFSQGSSEIADMPLLVGSIVTALAVLALATLRSGNISPGGVDNAGSVGIVLELARVLPDQVADDVELIFLSPGAEEDHMVGTMRWLDAHAPELKDRPVWAINFDGAGIPGRVALLERFGVGRKFSPLLSSQVRQAAAGLGIKVRGVFLPPAMGVDAIPFFNRGLECLTLASGALNRASLAVHSSGDVAENLGREALAEVARIAVATTLQLAGRCPLEPEDCLSSDLLGD
jgi:hypothetical protein